MRIITTIKEMQAEIQNEKRHSKKIGFVPTMGYLHEGHLTLLKKARQENDLIVLSIFVNPLQFGPTEDYAAYPRDFERDCALAEAEGVDYVFFPEVKEMYPNEPSLKVTVLERTDVLCGKSRPGHFDGVATVLIKLFNIVMPDTAYFGRKDAQQVAVVEGLINEFNFPIELVSVEVIREQDGLAKSSRNVKLLPEERSQAAVLYEGLSLAQEAIVKGERDPREVIAFIRDLLTNKTNAKIDYVELLTYPQLKPIEKLEGKFIIALAVKFSQVRLIDNVILEIEDTR
ncbi:pantoate--beta-alanine ligase [Bacillus sp. MRMR6]|uniref:pantoate--beta-alanine ligase n=1 Tax=Bacillus sp. MRMR6 TaxID=1928617 RepID=UPI000950F537|nr:pantoate--beta-alanine ligase [Bacillus sp. MRMR6]OLS40261.1 pantoate--beta-alanine ligase [Bacillus sp. MRMR6]